MTATAPERTAVPSGEWWASLAHGGMLIAPSKVAEYFAEPPAPLGYYLEDRLRRDVTSVRGGGDATPLLDAVLEGVLGLHADEWKKGPAVDSQWTETLVTRESLKPRRVWTGGETADGTALPVFVETDVKRLGVGRGRRTVARVVEWLRRSAHPIALVTNGQQWRLVHAEADSDAWCEWDIALWFEEGVTGPQVAAMRALLGRRALVPAKPGERPPLVAAIAATRKGQAELSAELGERVRRAVELVIRESAAVLEPLDAEGPSRVTRREIYIAACRLVMRCVVVLFAEARGLLPRENEIYESSYGLQSLREELGRRAGGAARERLRQSHGAWPRLVSLFRLIYEGSGHELLPIMRYGGGLFRPGNAETDDGILRALAAFEGKGNAPSDAAVHEVLDLLTTSRVRVRQGVRSTWVKAPVDFSDLSSEYIGILYEGLLDYELRRAPSDQPYVFLAIGDEPALPFQRLDQMTERQLKDLFEKLKPAKTKAGDEEDEEAEEAGEDEAEAETDGGDDADLPPEEADETEVRSDGDLNRAQAEMVQTWAERAVRAAGLVKRPRGAQTPAATEQWNRDVAAAARRLIRRVVMMNEWFLVRWGGTRKGSGTFYTRPQLAIPTVRRTLEPLAYVDEGNERRPRTPEEILAIKVCDPAMGSGSFLVAALRYLTEALVESLHFHGRLASRPEQTVVRLADGVPDNDPSCEPLPVAQDHPDFADWLRARLKRYVVERCVYGVDLDPLAVELGRLALWVETMDRNLPFEFLDHKLKCGNALIGCWFDQFRDYPVLAWEREGGDKDHANGTHVAKGQWTTEIKSFRNNDVREALRLNPLQGSLFAGWTDIAPETVHDDALAAYARLAALRLASSDEREEVYRDAFLDRVDGLRRAFDLWCAIWFWPADRLGMAPLPSSLATPSDETAATASELAREYRFFHWEFEFPDVFAAEGGGFRAIVGNPPWETVKPNSMEYFSNLDPLYRAYGKQEAVATQESIFERSEADERSWLAYTSHFKALSNFYGLSYNPWGDPADITTPNCNPFQGPGSKKKNVALHDAWRRARMDRRRYADPRHPYQYQGSADINLYKLFLERAHALLQIGGRLGMIAPSGIYTDKGSTALRELFLDRCRWEWLFGFENREGIFDIHRSFKFCPVIVEKGGTTEAIRAAFMRRSLEDWESAESFVLEYPRERVAEFSPNSKAILEIRGERDLEVLEKMYANGVLLGDQSEEGWGITYAREFDMTTDSKLFPPRPKWEEQGYRSDEYGHWLKGGWRPYDGPRSILRRPDGLILSVDGAACIDVDEIDDVALPLYEGRMIGQFDFSQKGWVSGKGRAAVWREIDWNRKRVEPQFLMGIEHAVGCLGSGSWKVTFMDICSATNARTFYGCMVADVPCGHTAPTLVMKGKTADTALLLSVLNSYATDFLLRKRVGGLHLTLNFLEETTVMRHTVPAIASAHLSNAGLRLSLGHIRFACNWGKEFSTHSAEPWRRAWVVSASDRLRVRATVDAVVGYSLGLDDGNYREILAGTHYPARMVSDSSFSRKLDPKGFWRIDKDLDPELRHTVLAQVAFHDLLDKGLDAFLAQNDGEGWMIPETLRLADYGLGHDDRAKEHQPVASRLGPRFLPWQLEQPVDESWEECERHADLIRRILPPPPEPERDDDESGPPRDLFGKPLETNLFGDVVSRPPKRRK